MQSAIADRLVIIGMFCSTLEQTLVSEEFAACIWRDAVEKTLKDDLQSRKIMQLSNCVKLWLTVGQRPYAASTLLPTHTSADNENINAVVS